MARKDGKPGRIKQIRETYRLTKKTDPKIGWILLSIFVAAVAVGVGVGLLLGMLYMFIPLGMAVGLLAVTVVFGRRAERSAYAQIDGQPGAAAAVLESLKRGWVVTPAVSMTKSKDVVHRVVGKPGVILISEGPANRVGNLLANERKKTARVVPDVAIIELQSGNEEGQIPLRRLNRTVMKQKRTLAGGQVLEVRRRLEALKTAPVGAPKGPLPKSVRAARIPRG